MPDLDVFWSFRSPYSYLAVDRLTDITVKYDIDLSFRPVRPLAMREPDFFSRGRPQFLPYLVKDVMRESQRLGVPFAMPRPDPIDMDMGSGVVAQEQPKLNRLMDLGVAACALGSGLGFAAAVSKRIWRGEPGWDRDDALAECAGHAGLEFSALSKWAAENEDEIDAIIEKNESDQLAHHWGVPLMVLDGEPFFGQDRLESLVWRLEQKGRRGAP